jgi:hypothetical protein
MEEGEKDHRSIHSGRIQFVEYILPKEAVHILAVRLSYG